MGTIYILINKYLKLYTIVAERSHVLHKTPYFPYYLSVLTLERCRTLQNVLIFDSLQPRHRPIFKYFSLFFVIHYSIFRFSMSLTIDFNPNYVIMDYTQLKDLPIKSIEANTGQIDGVPDNPRTFTQKQMDAMVKSLQDLPEMLQARPLIVYPLGEKYIVIGGNRRFEAAKQIKIQSIPCYILPPETPAETIRAYLIKDNLSFGDWDMSKLVGDWEQLELEEFGFDTDKLVEFEGTREVTQDEIEEDEFTEEVETVTKPGDVWTLGDHRLICGDSTDVTVYEKLMDGELADMVVTDPPYNVNYSDKNEFLNEYGKGNSVQTPIENDKYSNDSEFVDFLRDSFASFSTALKPGGAYYIWHAIMNTVDFQNAVHQAGFEVKQILTWVKNTFALGRQDYQWNSEPCLYGWKDGASHYFIDVHNETTAFAEGKDIDKLSKSELVKLCKGICDIVPTTTIHENKPAKNELHPTMKPVKLFTRLIRNSSKPGEIVLDPFAGSGTTAMACEQMGRKARLIELDPHYCDVIVTRWEEFTGRKAELWHGQRDDLKQ